MRNEEIRPGSASERPGCGERFALHPVLESAFDALNRAGINWCLIRFPSSMSAPTGDVDLLVDRSDNARTRRILTTLGFGTLQLWGRQDPEAFYVVYHRLTGLNLCLHVATQLSFGPAHAIRTDTAGGCLQRRRRRGTLYESHPKDAFWILLLHCLLDKGNVAPRYQADLRRLAEWAQADDELARVIEALCPAGWGASELIERVRCDDWGPLDDLARHLKDSTGGERPLDRLLQSAAMLIATLSSRKVLRYAWEKGRLLIIRCRGRRGLWGTQSRPMSGEQGLTVALLGPDGVGKSTLATNLANSLSDFAGVRTFYMGLGYGGLPRLARLPIPGSLAAVGLLTLWWRYIQARYHRRLGRIVVFDRYTYDAWLTPSRRLSAPQRVARWVWAHACPAPDLVLLLDAPGKAVYERRGESDPVSLEATRQDFLSLRDHIPGLHVVDAARSERLVRAEVAAHIRRRTSWNGAYA
jgi:thymidylate kinase